MSNLADVYQSKLGPKFYFTFGSSEIFPYQNGWVEVYGGNRQEACDKFNERFGTSERGLIKCAFIYSEENFKATIMFKDGNMGRRCHLTIL